MPREVLGRDFIFLPRGDLLTFEESDFGRQSPGSAPFARPGGARSVAHRAASRGQGHTNPKALVLSRAGSWSRPAATL